MVDQVDNVGKSLGCTLFGCLGGLFIGLGGGILLIIAVSFFLAISGPIPEPEPLTPDSPILQITVEEAFINRSIVQPPDGRIQIDLLPSNQVMIMADTPILVLGLPVQTEIIALLNVRLVDQEFVVDVVDFQVFGLDVPLDMTDLLSQPIAQVNQDLDWWAAELSTELGTPISINGLRTTDSQIELEIRATQ